MRLTVMLETAIAKKTATVNLISFLMLESEKLLTARTSTKAAKIPIIISSAIMIRSSAAEALKQNPEKAVGIVFARHKRPFGKNPGNL